MGSLCARHSLGTINTLFLSLTANLGKKAILPALYNAGAEAQRSQATLRVSGRDGIRTYVGQIQNSTFYHNVAFHQSLCGHIICLVSDRTSLVVNEFEIV